MQASWQQLPLLFICLYRFFSPLSFSLCFFIFFFYWKPALCHLPNCGGRASEREKSKINTYASIYVCVCVCAGVLRIVGKPNNQKVWMWGNVVDFHNLLFVWVHCRKKKAISRLWHWRLSGKSKHKLESYWIVLSCCVQCFFFFFFKRPSVAETRPNGPSQSIKCFRVCLLVC